LQASPDSVVVIDEAYVNFGGVSAVPLIARYPNLLVTHTLSKSRSLAGLRVGYAIGHADLIEALNRVKDSFNSYPLDRLAQAGALAAMEDQSYFEETWRKVVETRQRLIARLQNMDFEVVPSTANFVFVRHPRRTGADLAAQLRTRGIVVRNFQFPARIASYLRITVGTDGQCSVLTGALGEILDQSAAASPSSALS
jgi:histidinol-phosphate aminotransferase